MKKQLNFVLLLALGAGALAMSAKAQNSIQTNNRDNARVEYATLDPGQQSGLLRLADWDDHRRCDGDHDRDDRGCWNGNRYYPQYQYQGKAYYGGRYYGQNNGWYDRKGNFYPNGANGYFDKHGRWHYFQDRR